MFMVIDDEGRLYSFPAKLIKGVLHGEDNHPFHATRLATEDGLLRDKRFGVSDVYFFDREEVVNLEEAVDIIGGEEHVDEALARNEENQERVEKRQRYNDIEF